MFLMCAHVIVFPCLTLTVCVGRTKCEKMVETIPITKKAVAKVSANGVQ